jgi:hypothetical protein
MKLRGTSTMEVIMSMVISSIVILFISSAYQYVVKAYLMFRDEHDKVNELVLLNNSIQQSFIRSKKVVVNDNTISCDLGDRKINYQLWDAFIIRSEENKTDTFNINITETTFYFDGEVLKNKQGIIDALKIQANSDNEEQLLFFKKEYSSEILMDADENINNTMSDVI